MTSSDIVVLGRLADPYGIQGWLWLYPFGDDPLAWAEMPVWWIAREGEPWRECRLKSLKAHGNGVVVLLDGIADRSAAETMKGILVGAPREALPTTEKNEFYWTDLIGLDVINTADERLGKVTLPGVVPKLSRTPGEVRHPAHAVDADRESILADWLP